VTYLRISRQRRAARWWQETAKQAGLRPVPLAGRRPSRGPLRLLTFTLPGRAANTADASGLSQHDAIGGLE